MSSPAGAVVCRISKPSKVNDLLQISELNDTKMQWPCSWPKWFAIIQKWFAFGDANPAVSSPAHIITNIIHEYIFIHTSII